ncbi:Helicase ARIP4 [Frankliniella fusca]|uniref:Helicase ARIP4 n=1 Tax=Frankliniella fusca TaxID=407009 RepID=A0AAE1GVM6_9NEOP|nr:Helicase ARIP4 [Frankliniella fusca]
MDPFVTQIGDVTIQRVAPKSDSTAEERDDPQTDISAAKMDNSPSSSEVKKDASPSDQVEDKAPQSPKSPSSETQIKSESYTENSFEDSAVSSDVKNETPVKEEKSENSEGPAEADSQDNESQDGVMDASQFLKMAQAERDEAEYTGEKSEEGEDGIRGNEDLQEQESASDPSDKPRAPKSEPNDADEAMDEGDVNGGLEDVNYADQGFEGMEGEEMGIDEVAAMKGENNDKSFDFGEGNQLVKEEAKELSSNQGEEEGEDKSEGGEPKKKLRARGKRKIVVEDETDESEEERKKKRKKKKKKGEKGEESQTSEETESEDDGSGKKKKKKKKPKKKGKKKDDDDDGSGGEKSEKKTSNMRRNIRDVMDETQLDEATLAAQRQEMERLRRVQEQQRVLREMAIQKKEQQRAEHKVMSLLQGTSSILKQVSVAPSQASKSGSSSSSPNTVVVKVGSGATAQSNKKVLELLKIPKGTSAEITPSVTKTLLSKTESIQGETMMTPSVTIAPVRPAQKVVKQPSMIQAQASYSGSEGEFEGEEEYEEEEEGEIEEEIIDELDDEGKKKKKDVVTISSSSEDDCIVLSEPSDIEDDEAEDDPTNSGMHTNDAFNVPDEEGRVQIGGLRFLYDNVIESIERFSTSTGFGCILAHSMGLGKTLQVITFCDIFLRHTPAKTVMCIMPINTLQNWLSEFNMWMPDDPLATPLAAQGEVRPRTFNIYVLNDSHKTLKARAKVVEDWATNGGVLLIGYEMYRQLSLKKMSKPKKSRRKRVVSDDDDVDPEEEEKRQKELLEKVFEALVKPGPDLVICDEGHRIKNSHASISMALKQIRSKRRVVLTGYPLQNNLLEYWCMVDFVRPNYLGTKTEFCNMFERPIQNGQCIDSTPQDIRLMRYRAHVLHSLLEGFVQRRSHSVLTNALPQKSEYVLLIRMTPFQRKLYDTFMNEVVRTKAVPNPLKAFAVCCKIWNHPDVLYQFLKKREGGEGVDLDLEEAAAALAANTVIDPTGTPVDERKGAPKPRGRGGATRGRKKKEASPMKPAAAVIPNASQSDSNHPYGSSGQYSGHGQMNSNSMMGSYNPYGTSGQAPPYGSFNAPHHYNPSSSYGHAGYSGASGFGSSSSSHSSAQGSFAGSGSSGYGDSLASSPASQSSQYGSSSNVPMFSGSSSGNPPPAGSSGYSGMGPPYSFNSNSSSGQHSMTDGFSSNSNYNQSWSGSSYNSFNQGPPGNQSFSGSSYNSSGSNPAFQGYGGSGSSASFNQSMYGSGSSGSSSSSGQPYQPGLMDQQMLDQNLMAPPSRPSLNPNLIPQQSPVNASGMLPGGSPMRKSSSVNCHQINSNLIPMHSPVNASGMLPGGAPTKNSSMGLMGPGMGMSSATGMGEGMMSHHSQNMGMSNVYPNSASMMNIPSQPPNHSQVAPMAPMSLTSGDVPPSAEDLLHSSDDFRAFDPSMGKTEPGRGMYDVKDRTMYDPWINSHGHPQDYNMVNNQDMKPMQNSGVKKTENDKYIPGPSPLNQLKSEMGDLKLENKSSSEVDAKELCPDEGSVHSQKDADAKGTNSSDSWRVDAMEISEKDKDGQEESQDKELKEDEEDAALGVEGKTPVEITPVVKSSGKEDPGIPYDWAVELMKDYVPGLVENSAKMVLFFCILEEALALGDRILLFSQSLFTLSLIEEYLQRSFIPAPGVYERWQKNRSYFRLDGSTTAQEREKLINEFNANTNVHLFLVSTRAGSLGINLVGANRVIVFDASWNPCHDTQAVCRVYRYGQKKPCFVYRFVMDNCLEKKIYDRQINKQGMSDRVVDECNPDAHLSIKEVTNLCWDDEKESEVKDLSDEKDKYKDVAMQKILEKYGKMLTKAPFQHESLLVDRKDKKLSQAEKRLAKRSYEMEKRAANRPVYNYYNANQGGLQIRPVQRDAQGNIIKPIASVRPMQSELNNTLATDVVIPTNSPERSSIVLKAGQRVMVLKSPKGIYMQLENGKIIAIRTAFKMGANNKTEPTKPFAQDKEDLKKGVNVGVANKGNIKLTSGIHPLRNNPNITITPRGSPNPIRSGIRPVLNRPPGMRMQNAANMRGGPWVRPGGVAGRAVPLRPGQNIRPGLRGLSPSVTVTPANPKPRNLGPVTITPRLAPANFPVKKSDGKEKFKSDFKGDSKVDQSDRFESDDGQSSNSSMHSASSRMNDMSDSRSEKYGIEKDADKEDAQSSKQDGSFGSAQSSSKLGDGSALESKSSDGYNDSAVNHGTQDLSVGSMSDSSSASMKNFNLTANSHQELNNLNSQENRETVSGKPPNPSQSFSGSSMYSSSEKGTAQSSSAFSGNFSNSSGSKQYNSSLHSGSMMSPPSYNTTTDHSIDDSKSSSSIENQWKSPPAPQAFSPGVSSMKTASQPRNLESPAYDDNSNTSVHSNISSKSSAAHGSGLESRGQTSTDASYGASDLSMSHTKASHKQSSSGNSHSSSSNSKSTHPSTSSSSGIPVTTSSNFSPLDPYANLYSSYGAYPGGLPSSNYYNPYSYPPGFLPDPKSSLSSKSSTETNQNVAVSSSRSSSKSSSSSRSEPKKAAHESSRSTLPSGYDTRQPSSSSSNSSSSAAHNNRSGSSSTSSTAVSSSSSAPEVGSYSSNSSAAVAASYNPMMMSHPSFNTTSSQYPPPSAASGSANPFTAAAAAAANYPSPYASPYGYPGANQFESDLARASMYSAFHRPEAGLDPASPYLALPAHTRPMTGAASPASSFYSQNMYGGQYAGARDPYTQIPPYPASPLFMPPAPYGGLASTATSTATSDQSPSQ